MSDLTPNNDPFLQNPYPDDEIDLKELFTVLWGGKWLISAVAGIAAAISVVVALQLPNIYIASALLAPVESSGGGLSGLVEQYGGLASLAGVSLPGGEEGSRAQLGMQLMKSRAFIGDFAERRDILPGLVAVEFQDPGSGDIIFDAEAYDSASKTWVRDVEPPKFAKPSAQEAQKAFAEALGVSEDKQTGYVTVSIEYLKQQVANTSLADLQAMFFELIQSQTETVMLAEVRPEYVFKAIDPAVVPEEKSEPSRALICVLETLLGGMFGVITVLVRHYIIADSESA